MKYNEARALFQADRGQFEKKGAIMLPSVQAYIPDGWGEDYRMALDALPTLGTDPNSAIPAMLTTLIDPQIYQRLFAPNKSTVVLGEQRKGNWTDQTTMFPTTEHTGEVTSYDDYSENGMAGVNMAWPQRQSYLFQIMLEYGELEMERAGLGRINWVSEIEAAAATVMNKFSNLSYLYGIAGLENYGMINDPGLSAALTPSTKSGGGTGWANATANEIYNDIKALFAQLVSQADGLVESDDKLVLAVSPASAVAMTSTNSFAVNVEDLLKKNYPNLRVEQIPQYGVQTSANSQGVVGGNLIQLYVEEVEGQRTGFCAFNEKMRAHKLIPASSSYKQKLTGGTWGAVIRQPFGVSQMIGV